MRLRMILVLAATFGSAGLAIAACSSEPDAPANSAETDSGALDTSVPTQISDAGSADATGVDADNGAPSTIYPAFALKDLDLPYGQKEVGGQVIVTPKVVVITFANDPSADALDAFNDQLPLGTYWSAVTKEYGVGPLTISKHVRITENPPAAITDTEIQTWLKAKLADGSQPLGGSDSQTLFAINYPASTSISFGSGLSLQTSCTDFGGYHSEIGTTKVGYAVRARCSGSSLYTPLEGTFSTTSHEYVEWATDPYVHSAPAYDLASRRQWSAVSGGYGELADLCENFYPIRTPLVVDGGPVGIVQRSWSNKSSLAAHHPCVPVPPTEVYFNSSPVLTDDLDNGGRADGGGILTYRGVKVPIGTSKIVTLLLFSDQPTTGKWTVTVGKSSDPRFDYVLDRTSGENGEKLHLTITASSTPLPPDSGISPIGHVTLVSRIGTQYAYWPFSIAH